MEQATLIKIGNSLAVVIPRKYLRARGWMAGDKLTLDLTLDQVTVKNFDRRAVSFSYTRADCGDSISRRS